MDTFGILGFTFGLIGFSVAYSALDQTKKLKKEMAELRAGFTRLVQTLQNERNT